MKFTGRLDQKAAPDPALQQAASDLIANHGILLEQIIEEAFRRHGEYAEVAPTNSVDAEPAEAQAERWLRDSNALVALSDGVSVMAAPIMAASVQATQGKVPPQTILQRGLAALQSFKAKREKFAPEGMTPEDFGEQLDQLISAVSAISQASPGLPGTA